MLKRAFKNTVDPLSVTEEGREPVEEQNGDTKSGQIISRSSHRMLNHVIFKILIMAVAFGNCILIGFWTNPAVVKEHEAILSACDHIVFAVFLVEMVLKFCADFKTFCKNAWNLLDFSIAVVLIAGPRASSDFDGRVKVILQLIRSFRLFGHTKGSFAVTFVFTECVSELTNVFLLLFGTMVLFGVIGVLLFRSSVPSFFGDLPTALFTLFICATQDGWLEAESQFETGDPALMYGAMVYFIAFICVGAFIFTNFIVAVIIAHLEIATETSEGSLMGKIEDQTNNRGITHVEEVIRKTKMTTRQRPRISCRLDNLNMETFENLLLVDDALKRNQRESLKLHQELERILEEVSNLPVNRKQGEEVMFQSQVAASLEGNILSGKITSGRTADVLSTFIALEKAHIIDSSAATPQIYSKGYVREGVRRMSVAAVEARRMSRAFKNTVDPLSVTEEGREPVEEQNGDTKSGQIISRSSHRMLNHVIFKILIMAVAFGNCILIGFWTNPAVVKEHEAILSACDHIVFAVFLVEMVLKFCADFKTFCKNAWNLLDFSIAVVLIAGPRASSDFDGRVKVILQLIRSFRLFGHTKGSFAVTFVFTECVSELTNVFLLLFGTMVLFGVIGVLLFRSSVPSFFGDLPTALFTLFICATQDGWLEAESQFETGDPALMYGAMVYFIAFICVGAFIFTNFIVAVIIAHLEIATETSEGSLMGKIEDQTNNRGITHVEEVIRKTKMTTRQRPRISCRLDNLNMETFENLLLVDDALKRNQRESLKLHQELERILEEVSNLPVNRKQGEEVMFQSQVAASLEGNILSGKITSGRTADVLSTFIALEKAHIIDSSAATPQIYSKGYVREGVRRMSVAAVEARRMSRAFKNTVDPLSVTEEGREPVEEQNGDTKSGQIISRSSHRMLNHVIFKILIMAVAFGNCILIGFWTNPAVVKEHEAILSACDHIVFAVFLVEMVLKFCADFKTFCKNAWNLLDFSIAVVLIAGPRASSDFDGRVKVILQLIRSFRLFGHTKGSFAVTFVFTECVSELTNVFLLLFGTMVLFGVIGVLLFRSSVPSFFGDLPTALFTLFICATQDGWLEAESQFETGDPALMYGAMVYFIAFICVGAFIFTNFIVAVIIAHLEIATETSEGSLMGKIEDQTNNRGITHVEEVIRKTKMTTRQRPRISCRLDNLNMETFENLLLVDDALKRNQRESLKLHQELERILEEVSNLPVNRKQGEEVMFQSQVAASLEGNILSGKITSGRTADVLSTFIALEKAHIIDSSAATPQIYSKGYVREGVRRMSVAAVEARRMSRAFKNTVDPLSVTEEGREPVEEQNGDTKSGQIISRSSHRMLNHVIFKILIMAVAFGNCILIGFWTNPAVVKEHEAILSACDHIVFAVFLVEMVLKFCADFKTFCKNAWNLLDFSIAVVLIAGPRASSDFDGRVKVILQLIRSFRLFGHTKGSFAVTFVFTECVSELTNVFLLLFGTMVLFGVIGVLLFRSSVPSFFGDLPTALFTLFICATQDGWLEAESQFETGDPALMYGAMVYFIAFICVGAFIFTNFIVAVIIAHLEIATETSEGSLMGKIEDQTNNRGITHVEEVIRKTKMTTRQRPRISCRLDNLNMETFENLLLVDDALKRNQRESLKLHQELERILEEVSNLPVNRKQGEEVMFQSQVAASLEGNILSGKITSGRTADVLSTFIALEKAHIIDSSAATPQIYSKGYVREGVRRMSVAAVEARRMSVA
ncbi:hypothetical protein AOLI_G00114840 [Acnodon oligacanthus]